MFLLTLENNGDILLDTGECQGSRFRVVFKSWRQHLCWSVAVNDEAFESQTIAPGINLAACIEESQLSIDWWNALSQPFKANVLLFHEQSAYVLQLASRSRYVFELVETRPILLALLMCHSDDSATLINAAAKPQRKIGAMFGLPPTKNLLKFLNKYTCERFNKHALLNLLNFLRQPKHCQVLQHETTYTDATIVVALEHPWLISSPLWRRIQLSKKVKRKSFLNQIADCLMLAETLGINLPQRIIRNLSGLTDLQQLHDRWVIRVNAGTIADIPHAEYANQFCHFPYPNSNGIEAIKSQGELSEEGILLSHCIRSYLNLIMAGQYWAYRLILPDERATIGFKRDEKGAIILDQIRGYKNALVSQQASDYVSQWLKVCKIQ
ncbi:PcfJ domain-containing protein [Alishewanella sp. 16-MA]|uniref:PcfJ domain-containing protein n=1 Tax=Alishewanella maricola TaxID=2795740 RepID=A0ABS8C2R6_9ALTE|nr:PcfJ domain-containing protein [Alishewanella maricola]MCB5226637.1 PcfJ domain-containing protein [Alishewanella maricola]